VLILHGGSSELMTEIRLQPPGPFNFKVPDDWPRWLRRFEQFLVASGLKEASASKQVNTLLYCLGEEAESVLNSTNITEDERKTYDSVLAKFDSFFQIRRNVINLAVANLPLTGLLL